MIKITASDGAARLFFALVTARPCYPVAGTAWNNAPPGYSIVVKRRVPRPPLWHVFGTNNLSKLRSPPHGPATGSSVPWMMVLLPLPVFGHLTSPRKFGTRWAIVRGQPRIIQSQFPISQTVFQSSHLHRNQKADFHRYQSHS